MTARPDPHASSAGGAPASWIQGARDAGRRELFLDPEARPLRVWRRDLALFAGGNALLLTPVGFVIDPMGWLVVLTLVAAAALSGALLGGVFFHLCAARLRYARVLIVGLVFASLGALAGALICAAGGIVASLLSGEFPPPGVFLLLTTPGAIVGLVLAGWFGPAYGMGVSRVPLFVIPSFISLLIGGGALAVFLFLAWLASDGMMI